MVLDAVSNFVRGTADAQLTAGATTLSVADASIFPDPSVDGEFNVVIWDVGNFPRPDQDGDVEILRVTARDTTADEVTVVRAQEGTAAAAHPEGSAVHLSPTAKMFGDIEGTFADFWDAGTQELTADVNNQSVSTGGATINDKPAFSGAETSAVSPGFDVWTEASPLQPTLSEIRLTATTDGSVNAQIAVQVDESGGTTPDYDFLVYADKNLGDGGRGRNMLTVYLPAGAQYRIENQSDPVNGNEIEEVRQLTMG